ncbi:MAG: hypothetical protein IJK63_07640 [Oscillospiraceae bacterium]|nr:hypothetical protein [Oscillospiraceae bacterium]
MKKLLSICAVLLLCATLLAGCAGEAGTPDEMSPPTEQSPVPEQETDSPAPPTPPPTESTESLLARIEEQKEVMKAFLLEHQAEMEELVAVMMAYSVRTSENEFTFFEYNVIYHKLHQTHRIIRSITSTEDHRERLEEHPILAKVGFLDGEPPIQYVLTDLNHRIVDNDICFFSQYLRDVNGNPFCDVYLFYCEEEPVEKEYFAIEAVDPMLPHWYFYVEWLE